jgi:hypothetical protein
VGSVTIFMSAAATNSVPATNAIGQRSRLRPTRAAPVPAAARIGAIQSGSIEFVAPMKTMPETATKAWRPGATTPWLSSPRQSRTPLPTASASAISRTTTSNEVIPKESASASCATRSIRSR